MTRLTPTVAQKYLFQVIKESSGNLEHIERQIMDLYSLTNQSFPQEAVQFLVRKIEVNNEETIKLYKEYVQDKRDCRHDDMEFRTKFVIKSAVLRRKSQSASKFLIRYRYKTELKVLTQKFIYDYKRKIKSQIIAYKVKGNLIINKLLQNFQLSQVHEEINLILSLRNKFPYEQIFTKENQIQLITDSGFKSLIAFPLQFISNLNTTYYELWDLLVIKIMEQFQHLQTIDNPSNVNLKLITTSSEREIRVFNRNSVIILEEEAFRIQKLAMIPMIENWESWLKYPSTPTLDRLVEA